MAMTMVECGCTYKQFGDDPLRLSVKPGCREGRRMTLQPRLMASHLGLLAGPCALFLLGSDGQCSVCQWPVADHRRGPR